MYGINTAQDYYDIVMKRCPNCMSNYTKPCSKHQELSKLIDFENLPGDVISN